MRLVRVQISSFSVFEVVGRILKGRERRGEGKREREGEEMEKKKEREDTYVQNNIKLNKYPTQQAMSALFNSKYLLETFYKSQSPNCHFLKPRD